MALRAVRTQSPWSWRSCCRLNFVGSCSACVVGALLGLTPGVACVARGRQEHAPQVWLAALLPPMALEMLGRPLHIRRDASSCARQLSFFSPLWAYLSPGPCAGNLFTLALGVFFAFGDAWPLVLHMFCLWPILQHLTASFCAAYCCRLAVLRGAPGGALPTPIVSDLGRFRNVAAVGLLHLRVAFWVSACCWPRLCAQANSPWRLRNLSEG